MFPLILIYVSFSIFKDYSIQRNIYTYAYSQNGPPLITLRFRKIEMENLIIHNRWERGVKQPQFKILIIIYRQLEHPPSGLSQSPPPPGHRSLYFKLSMYRENVARLPS